MRRLFFRIVPALVLAIVSGACSNGPSAPSGSSVPAPSQPSTPSPPPPAPQPVNHPPTITTASVTAFGVSDLTPLTFSASATDEDNDAVTYKWSFGGQTSTSQSFTTTLSGDGLVAITLTVADARGAQASTTVTTILGTLTGQWNLFLGNGSSCGPFGISRPPVMTLTQSGQKISGAIASPGGWCNVPGGTTGSLDPGAPGSVDAAGNVSMRLKIGQFLDTFLSGRFSTSGREITGTTSYQDSGLRSVFTMRKL